jgi:hypothetical protein
MVLLLLQLLDLWFNYFILKFNLKIYKNVDWRWILSGAGAVAGFYCFERLRWDNGAKEERLKNQFRQHLEQRFY